MMDPTVAMKAQLVQLQALRGAAAVKPARLGELKHFQAERLARSYEDIAAQPRYRAATGFFLADLYGPKDFSRRDADMARMVPAMRRVLPAFALETAAHAIELESLSEALDHRVAAALPDDPIDDERYAQAYRAGSTREQRMRQIELVVAVGERLDTLVAKPFIFRTLKLMRQPARLAGLEELQNFLERGFQAFHEMGGADHFLTTVRDRETQILNRLFSGEARPFSI
jgi:hypothetical protein